MANEVMHGAIALIKVNNNVIGKMKNVRVQENVRRQDVIGLGSIFLKESPVVGWTGTLSCSSFAIDLAADGIPNAFKRGFSNIVSQALSGQSSMEDQLILDSTGVDVYMFKKVEDLIDPVTKIIKPKAIAFCIVRNCLIESDSFDISEGQLSGKDQSFKYLQPYQLI